MKARDEETRSLLRAEAAARRAGADPEVVKQSSHAQYFQTAELDPRMATVRQDLAKARAALGCSTDTELLDVEAAAADVEFRKRARQRAARETLDAIVATAEAKRLPKRDEPTRAASTARASAPSAVYSKRKGSFSTPGTPRYEADIVKMRANAAAAREALERKMARAGAAPSPPPAPRAKSARPRQSRRGRALAVQDTEDNEEEEISPEQAARLAQLKSVEPPTWAGWREQRRSGLTSEQWDGWRARRLTEIEEAARARRAAAEATSRRAASAAVEQTAYASTIEALGRPPLPEGFTWLPYGGESHDLYRQHLYRRGRAFHAAAEPAAPRVPTGDTEAKAEAAKPAAKPAGATPQWPPPTVAIAGTEYAVGVMLGKGVWADVFKGTGPAGEEVALKMLRDLKEKTEKNGDPTPFEKLMPPRNSAEQQAENVIECKIHKCMQSIAAGAGADCAKVPRMLGSDATNSAIEFIEAMSLEAFLRKSDRSKIDDADAAVAAARQVTTVLAVVIKKVFTLYGRAKGVHFSHRDLNDGNIMLRLNTSLEDVRGLEDVDVWLFDFGKSMARLGGRMVSGGMWNPACMPIPRHDDPSYDGCRISAYNETTDTVRLLSNITQSLIRSYEPLLDDAGKKVSKKSPTGATRTFLEANMPFRSQMATWLAHTKEKLGAEEFDQLWDKSVVNAGKRSVTHLSGKQDYLDFAAQPSFDIMRKYYVLEEADWCECMLPAKLIEFCDRVLANA